MLDITNQYVKRGFLYIMFVEFILKPRTVTSTTTANHCAICALVIFEYYSTRLKKDILLFNKKNLKILKLKSFEIKVVDLLVLI